MTRTWKLGGKKSGTDAIDGFPVLGIVVSDVDYDSAVAEVVAAASEGDALSLSALAVHGVMTGVLDGEQAHRLNHIDLVVPDGQPVRWALNLLHGARLSDRVYGPELMLRVCAEASSAGIPIGLFGSTPDVLEALQRNLLRKFEGLKINCAIPSRFRRLSEEERVELLSVIKDSGARVLFVGLGCPRQEVWAYENAEELSMPVLGVGAAFDFHAGKLNQAPAVLQKAGLEWLYRLVQEPRRLWKRYLLLNPLYVALLGLQAMGVRRFTLANEGSPPLEKEAPG